MTLSFLWFIHNTRLKEESLGLPVRFYLFSIVWFFCSTSNKLKYLYMYNVYYIIYIHNNILYYITYMLSYIFLYLSKFQYFKVTLWVICGWRSSFENLSFKPSIELLFWAERVLCYVFEIEAEEIPNMLITGTISVWLQEIEKKKPLTFDAKALW